MNTTKTLIVGCIALAASLGALVAPAAARPILHRHPHVMMHHHHPMMHHRPMHHLHRR